MLEELPRDLESAAGVGGEADAIEREVMRRCGHGIHAELIRLAVQDAVERRKPRR